ncbi:outer membrane beta-barrel protein [Helicobacter ailurogastricus]|uniref:outer membrane beta-barrel protein n=1 Tax=Helicobacter ailurogastricus TaxID=1578720 RepID=UPI0006B54929|nr:outer membrane beta-barrel protein [Helicobacter ailurogastricus]
MLRVWVFILCLMGLGAHPFASYLDGPFASFGMDVGGGSIAHEYLYNPPINAVKEQAYQTELKAYNVAVAKLKTDQGQTINTLKTIAGILSHFTLTSTKATALLANLNALDTNNQTPSAINKSVQEYEAYLQKILEEYSNANQDKINQAENALSKYVQEISNYENTINSQPSGQDLQILQNAINSLENFNTQIAQVAKDLNVPFTPFALPAPLNANGSNINTLSKAQIQTALNALSNELGAVISGVSGDIKNLSVANQKIAIDNANAISQLDNEKQEASEDALNQIVAISQSLGRAFHYLWENYAVGKGFDLDNADPKNMKFINNTYNCTFALVFGKYADGSAYNPGVGGLPNSCGFNDSAPWNKPPFMNDALSGFNKALSALNTAINTPSSTSKTHTHIVLDNTSTTTNLTPQDIWNTLFNVSKLEAANFPLMNSNCAGKLQCGGNQPRQQANKFFNFLNGYIGDPSFAGNFTNSQLYQDIKQDLTNGQFTQVENIVNVYAKDIIPSMLQIFTVNPVWFLNSPGNSPQVIDYCKTSDDQGLAFSQGYKVCDYQNPNGWGNGIFLGYFGLTGQAPQMIENGIQAIATQAQTQIQAAQKTYNEKPTLQHTFPIPAISSPPSIPLKGTPPLPPLPLRPIISTSPAPMPTINAPNKPALIFASGNLRANSLQLGLQAQGGYQKYFTPFFGVSTYGYFAYRYLYMGGSMSSQTNLSGLNRYSLGFGANLLTNFYSKIQKTGHGRTKIQTYGLFAGLLALGNVWNAYILQAPMQTRFNFNVDGVFGLSVRLNRFKWSLGVHVPLVGQTQMIKAHTKEGFHEELQLIDNYKSSQLFLNFTQIF